MKKFGKTKELENKCNILLKENDYNIFKNLKQRMTVFEEGF